MKTINKLLICMIFLMAVLPMVSAESSAESLGVFKNGDCVNLIQICSDCTYVNITSVIYPNSTVALSDTVMSQSGTYFYHSFCDTDLNGIYIVTGIGDQTGVVEVWNYDFTITPNGEDASIGKAVFYIGLLTVLLFFLVLIVLSFANFDNLLNRVGMIGLGYLLLISITFIGWNMAGDFLTSSPFLVEMLRILFWILIVGLFPLVIGGFAWYLIMLFKIKEIERLMDRGIDRDEAERRGGRKYK